VSSSGRPVRLERKLVERPWGGELWFTAHEELPLLIKFIYTQQALSFQVHPGDDYAAAHHNSRGKTEMWYIVSATPEARIALGFRESITKERLRAASESGEIKALLNWISPQPGDTFFTPAGTVHAIGAGIELWEIQENSDITYRLFDYGRGRELHLDHGVKVTNTECSDPGPVKMPICCDFFCTERVMFDRPIEYRPDPARWQLLICVRGRGAIAGEPFEEGQVWLIPVGSATFELRCDAPVELLRTWVP
jgi:mannose-6-phosphate isomerase